MKKLITNYQFNSANGQITFVDYLSINLSSVLLITNTTDNIIIYNFASPPLGATVSGNVLDLNFDTSSMSDTDSLQIYYDDTEINAATEETLSALQEQNILMRRLLKMSESLSVVDTNQRQRVIVEGTVTTSTSSVVRPVDSTSNVIYVTNGNAVTSYIAIPEFWKYVDTSRLNYQQAIRSNLSFS